MNVTVAIFADFQRTFLGTPACLDRELGGTPIISRTLQRVVQLPEAGQRCLFVTEADQPAAEQALVAAGVADEFDVLPLDPGQRRRGDLLRCGRKWQLQAWRGGVLGTTWFDEYVEAGCVARVLQHYQSDAVLCLSAYQPLLDLGLTRRMLQQSRDFDEVGTVFTQAPPGLTGLVLRQDAVAHLLEQDIPIGLLMSYRPEMPRVDPINQPGCVRVPAGLVETPARLTGDTRRSRELLERVLADLGDAPPAEELGSWLARDAAAHQSQLPREVELELTTAAPLPDSTLRPWGGRVPERQLGDLAPLRARAEELAAYDDQLVMLRGHGDPLLHPEFAAACRLLREAGICGIAVESPLVQLSAATLEALFAQRVDLLVVRLDANSVETYQRVHRAAHFEQVLENIMKIETLRRERLSAAPIVAPSLTRSAATFADMEAFYDHWIRTTGWALIEGYREFGGVLPPDTLLAAEPPLREPCRRLSQRLTLLADGRATLCGEDPAGAQVIGAWFSDRLSEIWRAPARETACRAHETGNWSALPVCGQCREWFRP